MERAECGKVVGCGCSGGMAWSDSGTFAFFSGKQGAASGGHGDHQAAFWESSGRFSVEPSTRQLAGVGEASSWTGVCQAAVAKDEGKREDKLL